MYKVKRIAEGNLTSQGIMFEFGKEVIVDERVFNYLKNTFPNDFEFIKADEKRKENKKQTRKSPVKKEVVTK